MDIFIILMNEILIVLGIYKEKTINITCKISNVQSKIDDHGVK